MISEIVIRDPSRTCVPWWDKVEFLKGKERIPFEPGLNILWGPNGSGKSTVLAGMARMLHAEQGGRTVVTGDSIRTVTRLGGFRDPPVYLDGVVPVHDGQALVHFDPTHRVGLVGGSFDFDFLTEGAQNVYASKASSGQQVLYRIQMALDAAFKGKIPDVEWKIGKPDPNGTDPFRAIDRAVLATLQGTLPKGQPTVLLDEPDRSLAVKYQANLWWNLALKAAGNAQIIATSHSIFALNVPGAHYIETEPGAMAEAGTYIDQFLALWEARRPADKPAEGGG